MTPLHWAPGSGLLPGKHRGAGTVAEQAGTDEHSRIIVQVHGGTAYFDADRQHMLALAAVGQRTGQLPVGQRPGTALPHEVIPLHIPPQGQVLAYIAAQARTQVARTGGNDYGINLRGVPEDDLFMALVW